MVVARWVDRGEPRVQSQESIVLWEGVGGACVVVKEESARAAGLVSVADSSPLRPLATFDGSCHRQGTWPLDPYQQFS